MLLDSHVFLWWDQADARLGRNAARMIADPDNQIYVSAAVVWEISIKRRLGKLAFAGSLVKAIGDNGFFELGVLPVDGELAGELDWAHRDPFDRLLVAQSRRLNAPLVTADWAVREYDGGVTVWAG